MKLLSIVLLFVTGCSTFGKPVVFQSEESKTIDGAPVFNEISFTQQGPLDIWMMRQSHHGLNAEAKQWDRIAIVVDKWAQPKTAEYWELEPGPLVWQPTDKKIALKAVCFSCHANGPRAIRPDPNWNLTWNERAQIIRLNNKIKNYGRIVLKPTASVVDATSAIDTAKFNSDFIPPGGPPVQYRDPKRNQILNLKSCNKCHQAADQVTEEELDSEPPETDRLETAHNFREPLRLQNAATIDFMIKKHQMPPPGFQMSKEDQESLQSFLKMYK